MNIEIPDPEVEPVLCDICGEEIKVGDKFIEVKTNQGVHTGGYIKGRQYWKTDTDYIHLKHVLYAQVSE